MIVAWPATGHTIVKIGFSASGNRQDVIDGQLAMPEAAIYAGVTISHQHVSLSERNTITVNTAYDLDQHHYRRYSENLSDTFDHAIRIFQNLGLFGKQQTHSLFPINMAKIGIVAI